MSTLILVCDKPVSHGTFSSVNSAGPSIDMLDIDRMFPCEKQSICLNSLNVFSWSHMLNRATLPSTTASRSNPPTAENKVFYYHILEPLWAGATIRFIGRALQMFVSSFQKPIWLVGLLYTSEPIVFCLLPHTDMSVFLHYAYKILFLVCCLSFFCKAFSN